MIERSVLHLLWTGRIGGAERAVYQLVKCMVADDSSRVAVAFGRAEGPYARSVTELGCEVIDMGMRSGSDLPKALKHVARMRDFDIHHFHSVEPTLMIASTRCKRSVRVFTQRHGRHSTRHSTAKDLRRSLTGSIMRRYFDAVSGNTIHATEYAVERYRLQSLPTCTTYNGLDPCLLKPVTAADTMRKRLGLDGSFTVCSAGSFISLKRFDRLVELLASFPNIHVLLIGDGPLRPSFEDQARALGALDRLHLTGKVYAVADYLQLADLFVLPSDAEESFGNAMVEAMTLGIPSAAFSDSPALCEHLENRVTGFVLDGEPDLVNLVGELSSDDNMSARVGESGASYVRQKYSIDNMRSAYEQLYGMALEHRDARHRYKRLRS